MTGLAIGIEQAQLNLGGVRREDREIDSQPVPGGAKWEGKTFTDTRRRQNLRRRRLFSTHEISDGNSAQWLCRAVKDHDSPAPR